MAEPVYRFALHVASSLLRSLAVELDVQNFHHVPSGGAVIATNHVSYLDFAFVGVPIARTGRVMRFVARKEVFDHPVAGPLMRGMSHIEVDPYGDPHAVFVHATRALQAGEMVFMHPEGTISPSFVPLPGKTGTVRMAIAAGVPIVPAAVWGGQRLVTKWRPKNFQRHVAVTVRYGEPFHPDPDDPKLATKELMERISVLLDEAQDRYPQQPAGPHDRWWIPAHRGGTAPTYTEAAARLEEMHAARRAAREREKHARRQRRRGR